MFTVAELDRYARHIVLDGVGPEGQARLRDARVVVVGAGGLGAPVLLYLAAAGVGHIDVYDDDDVTISNLQRQVLFDTEDVGRSKAAAAQERLEGLNPEIAVRVFDTRIDGSNAANAFAGADAVLDGSDTFGTRYVVNDACVAVGVPLVHGAVAQFHGQVSVFHGPLDGGIGPCYRCVYPEPPEPGTVPSCAEAGVFGALPGTIGSLMASEAIKLIVGVGDPLVGRLLHLDLLDARFHTFELQRDPNCAACSETDHGPQDRPVRTFISP